MIYIKNIMIKNFKKFKNLDIFDFNKNINIFVGVNESGKSTLLEVIDLVLNKIYINYDKYIIKEILNQEAQDNFKKNPCVENLPEIIISIEFEIEDDEGNLQWEYLNGTNYHLGNSSELKNGIEFICRFDTDYLPSVVDSIKKGEIPYEYYEMSWNTFQGSVYSNRKIIKSLFINNSSVDTNNSFNYYNKNLFNNKYTNKEKMEIKNNFRELVNNGFGEIIKKAGTLGSNETFGISCKKTILEKLLIVYGQDGIALENKGKGVENLIKTEISLQKDNNSNIVLIEEPENHLSYLNLKKMINNIENNCQNSQLILTTHSNLIAKNLNLKNVFLMSNNGIISFKELSEDVGEFFKKIDNYNLLQLILAEKVILVEGSTEHLLIPKIFEKEFEGDNLENNKIEVISCCGVSYKKYLAVAEKLNIPVAVITDNDESDLKINEINNYNEKMKDENIKIFTDKNINNWTWEVCLYNLNEAFFNKKIKINPKAQYKYGGYNYDKHLMKMLNNKVDIAYECLEYKDFSEIQIPEYFKQALSWIKKI